LCHKIKHAIITTSLIRAPVPAAAIAPTRQRLSHAAALADAVRLAVLESEVSRHNHNLAQRHLAALQQQKQQLAALVQQLQVCLSMSLGFVSRGTSWVWRDSQTLRAVLAKRIMQL
jgi:hypothetical protein